MWKVYCSIINFILEEEILRQMYARILLMKSVKMKKEIELPSPLPSKPFFHQFSGTCAHKELLLKCWIIIIAFRLYANISIISGIM